MKYIFSALILTIVLINLSYAQMSTQAGTRRPSVVEPAKTMDKNQVKIETGFLYNYYEYDYYSSYYIQKWYNPYGLYDILPTMISYGAFNTTELRVGGSYRKYSYANFYVKQFNPLVNLPIVKITPDYDLLLFAGIKQHIYGNDDFNISGLLNFTNYKNENTREINERKEVRNIHENQIEILITGDIYLDKITLIVNQGLLSTLKIEDYGGITSGAIFYHFNDDLDFFVDLNYWYNLKILFEKQQTYNSILNNFGAQYKLTDNIAVDISGGYEIASNYKRFLAGGGFTFNF